MARELVGPSEPLASALTVRADQASTVRRLIDAHAARTQWPEGDRTNVLAALGLDHPADQHPDAP